MKKTIITIGTLTFLLSGWFGCSGSNVQPQIKLDDKMKKYSCEVFLKGLEKITDPVKKQARVDKYIEMIASIGAPVIENDTTVYFLYQSAKEVIYLTGDMNEWDGNLPMAKITGTDLHYLKFTTLPAARLEYWVIIEDGGWPSTDPLNPYKVWNGLGAVSELALPGYTRHPALDEFKFGKKWDPATLDDFIMPAGVMDYEHQIHVYLPPDYDPARKYATVYIQDGLDYVEFAIVPGVLNYLIERNEIEPLIVVFITPPNRHQPKMPNRMTEYGLNDDYVDFVCDELVPEIERRYSVRTTPDSRLVLGDSYGGLISFYTGFKRPDVFGLAYSQSGYLSFQQNSVINQVATSPKKPIRFYVDVGLFEHKIGVGLLPEGENDFLQANREAKIALEAKGYDFVYHEYPEGHNWGNWRRHLIDGLKHFFATSN